MLEKYALRSKISMDEEEARKKEIAMKLNQELNRTALRFKELSEEFQGFVDKKDIDSIDSETQKKIMDISNVMSQLVEGQALLISGLIKGVESLVESQSETISETPSS
jgi:hypothetical protein